MVRCHFIVLALLACASVGLAEEKTSSDAEPAKPTPKVSPTPPSAIVTSIEPSALKDFDDNPPAVRRLLEKGLALTRQNLTYLFGSSDPSAGGMDCSGTIFHLLRSVGIDDVPRTASEQYVWARKADNFEPVVSRSKESFELDDLRPGDLLFWTGTYATKNDPPVTHTMIYLGELESDGRQVMFGASDGRSFDGRKMWGVSVFDFTIPKLKPKPGDGPSPSPGSVFIGYARIPGLSRAAPGESEREPAKERSKDDETRPASARKSPDL